jgi:hypothetical protein
MDEKMNKAKNYYLSKLFKNNYIKIRQYQVYCILVKEFYASYCEYKEENTYAMLNDEMSGIHLAHALENQTDSSMIQDLNKMETIMTEKSKQNCRPISFIDDTVLSIK